MAARVFGSSLTPKILNGCDPAGKVGEDSVFPVALGLATSFAASALILDTELTLQCYSDDMTLDIL